MDQVDSAFKPWVSIWLSPRVTIDRIVASNPEHMVVALAAAHGVVDVLSSASDESLADSMPMTALLGLALVIGPLAGVIGLYISSWLLRWTGRWLRGDASGEALRATIAWSGVPVVAALPLWLAAILVFGRELFTEATPRLEASSALSFGMLGFGLAWLALLVWSMVLFFGCLAEVQRFSIWKAVGNALLAGLVLVAAIVLVVLLVVGAGAALQ
jgi:hypothetical protein